MLKETMIECLNSGDTQSAKSSNVQNERHAAPYKKVAYHPFLNLSSYNSIIQ